MAESDASNGFLWIFTFFPNLHVRVEGHAVQLMFGLIRYFVENRMNVCTIAQNHNEPVLHGIWNSFHDIKTSAYCKIIKFRIFITLRRALSKGAHNKMCMKQFWVTLPHVYRVGELNWVFRHTSNLICIVCILIIKYKHNTQNPLQSQHLRQSSYLPFIYFMIFSGTTAQYH